MLHTCNISYKCAKNRIITLSHITDKTLVSLPFTQSLPRNPIHHQSSLRESSFFFKLIIYTNMYQINAYLTPYFAWNWNGVKFSFLPFNFCIDPLTYITSSAVLVYISVKSFPPVCLSDLQHHQKHNSK